MAPKTEDLTTSDPPTAINPYQVLSLDKSATQDQIKTAYRKAALKHHPDKASPENKDTAHTRFQEVAFAYAILSDKTRRSRYDRTGRTDESILDDDNFDWSAFFRTQFEDVVTAEAIEKFREQYKGSEEERQDVLDAYEEYKGDLDKMFETIMLSDPLEDTERFIGIVDGAIAEEDGPKLYPKWTKTAHKGESTKRKQRARKEAQEAEEYAKELGVHGKLFGEKGEEQVDLDEELPLGKRMLNGMKRKKKKDGPDEAALASLLRGRAQQRAAQHDDLISRLEEKYAPKGKGKKRAAMEEPPEEAFQKNSKKSSKVSTANESTGTRRSKRSKS